jgi:hypothetical protein
MITSQIISLKPPVPNLTGGLHKLGRTTGPIFGDHLSSTDIMPAAGSWTAFHLDNGNVLTGSAGHDFRLCPSLLLENLGGASTPSATMSVSEPPHERPSQTGYYNWVRSLGWELDVSALLSDANGRIHEDEPAVDGAVRRRIRASADNPYVDQIFVLSGDGGMVPAARYARRAGKRVIVLAWSNTLHPALAAAASGFAFIDDLGSLIGRPLTH